VVRTVWDGPRPLISTNVYDPESGRLAREMDPNGNSVQYGFDGGTGDLKRIIEGGSLTELAYDRFGNLESLTDSNGNVTTFHYDALQRLAKVEAESLPLVELTAISVAQGALKLEAVVRVHSTRFIVEEKKSLSDS
jgi:YD repeat-containing protein